MIEKPKPQNGLKVFYGLRKLTASAVKKPSILVVFENDNTNSSKNEKFVAQKMKILHTRLQTELEKLDYDLNNRTFSSYEIFLSDRRFKGDVERAIEFNHQQDSENVSLEERNLIAEKIRAEIYDYYGLKKKDKTQLELDFEF